MAGPAKITTIYLQSLVSAGFTGDQALVYETLLRLGKSKASKIAQATPIKRSLVYKLLGDLVDFGVVLKVEPAGKVATFEPAHPAKLKEFVDRREQEAKNAQAVLEGLLGQMTSDYNLALGRPGVRFFEGLSGIQKVGFDSLSAKTEILAYVDSETLNREYPELNKEYGTTRKKKHLKKKILAPDSETARVRAKELSGQTTEMRLIPSRASFSTIMQIYDNKVSYVTLDPKRQIGIIIDDPAVAQMHRVLFEIMWSQAIVPDQEKKAANEPRESTTKPIIV